MKRSAPLGIDDDLSLLRTLLAISPSQLRRTTLLEALEMTRSEVPQSLFLAWLLGPQGPLTDCWLLKAILELAAPSTTWPGTPQSVLSEVAVDSERADIIATWESFKLIVEYKVDSSEGKDQINRYLKTFKVARAVDGMVVYLTPTGKWPTKVSADDERVYALSFHRLIDAINRGLERKLELSERGRVIVEEYRDCLSRVLNRSINVTKPVISEATKLLGKHHEHFDRLVASSRQEATDMIEYVAAQAEKEMRSILGPEMVVSVRESWGIFMFRRPDWVTDELEYGFAYGCNRKLGARAMHDYTHYISIRVQPIDRSVPSAPSQKRFSESLHNAIEEHLPAKNEDWNAWHAFDKDVPFTAGGDWDKWAEDVVKQLGQTGRTLTKHIDRFAARAKTH
jgi:hypothetical protein